jgi:hypothetical protein
MEKEYKELCDWMKRNLGDKVAKVQISKRISSSPCVLVSGKFGWSANMERYARLRYMLICGAKLRVTSFASELTLVWWLEMDLSPSIRKRLDVRM